jgi:hypothetical protein
VNADDVQAVEQVFAELAKLHPVLQVLIGRGDDTYIGFHLIVSADAVELAILQHAQQARLQRRRHVTDFIEEQRAAIGLLEPSLALQRGPGESALFVAEELGFEQVRRDRGDIDGDKGFVGARLWLQACATSPCRCRIRR